MHVACRTEARIRLGLRRVLPLEQYLLRIVGAQLVQAPAETLLLQCGLEKIRAGVGHRDQT